jgi:antitoxin component YwqK of YwqJK toxin-antitoxin module
MKLPHLLLLLGASGLAVSVYALQGHKDEGGDKQTTYYSNGQIKSETCCLAGRSEGKSTRYYPDGKKLAEGNYKAGKMDGEWTFWNQDGSVDPDRSGTFTGGERQGAAAAQDTSEH